MGPHPEAFLGLQPQMAEPANHERLLPYLVDWDSDLILQHSVAYLQVAEQGFHIPSGVLHAPGSALTIELQEDSDVFAMLQALNAGTDHLEGAALEGRPPGGPREQWASGSSSS